MVLGSSACGWSLAICLQTAKVVYGWLLVPKTGRLRMTRGRLRMACGRPLTVRIRLRMACVVHQTGRLWMARGRPRMAQPVHVLAVSLCEFTETKTAVQTALQILDKVVVMPVVVQRQVPPCGSPWRFHGRRSWTTLLTCPLLCYDRCPLFGSSRSPWRFRFCRLWSKVVDLLFFFCSDRFPLSGSC